MKCNAVDLKSVNWQVLDSFQDRTVFQTREWVQFVGEAQRATPVLLEMTDNGKPGRLLHRPHYETVWREDSRKFFPWLDYSLHGIQSYSWCVARGCTGSSRVFCVELLSAACTWKSPILISRKKTADRLDLTWNITRPIARI